MTEEEHPCLECNKKKCECKWHVIIYQNPNYAVPFTTSASCIRVAKETVVNFQERGWKVFNFMTVDEFIKMALQ